MILILMWQWITGYKSINEYSSYSLSEQLIFLNQLESCWNIIFIIQMLQYMILHLQCLYHILIFYKHTDVRFPGPFQRCNFVIVSMEHS